MNFHTRYNPPPKVASPSGGVSMTEQQYKDECDVNSILKRYKATGILPTSVNNPVYADVSECGDFMANFEKVNKAKADFLALPSEVRERFGHDVNAFYAFVSNPDNIDEMIRLGLATKHVDKPSVEDLLGKVADGVTSLVEKSTPSSAE